MTPDYAALAAELAKPAYTGLSDADAAAALTAQTASRRQLPALTSAAQLLSLAPTSFPAVFDHPRFSDFKATFDQGSRSGVLEWAAAFHTRGTLIDAEYTAVVNYLTTEADTPCSPADLIGWPVPPTAADVAHARSLS